MRRRTFLTLPLINGLVLSGCSQPQGVKKKESFEAFIVSDAHMGWLKKDQPDISEQQKAVRNIHNKFPNLDLWIDTGDAHHTGLKGEALTKARQDWKNVVANNSNGAPLFYVPGNHELGGSEIGDPEHVACNLGGIQLRPYYSFEMCNIRFISVPQLIKVNQISQETLNWLDLELTMAANKSVIILSHNAIQNTTYHGANTVYRAVANSKETLDVINKHENVLAWMHGHNHQYEVVNKHNRFYVSNGRIGGFIPSKAWGDFGQGHLGGMYLKITEDSLEIKGYSATKDDFFEYLGKTHLSGTKKVRTSFDASVKSKVQIGHGLSQTQAQFSIRNHYMGTSSENTVSSIGVGKYLNDNPNLTSSTDLVYEGKKVKNLIGSFYLSKQASSYPIEVSHDKIFFKSGKHQLYFPRPSTGLSKKNKIRYRRLVRGHYYQAIPGRTYQFTLLTQNMYSSLGKVRLACINTDRSISEFSLGSSDDNTWTFQLPGKDNDTGVCPESFYLILDKDIDRPVQVLKIMLQVVADATNKPQKIEVIGLQGEQRKSRMNTINRLGLPAVSKLKIGGESSQLYCWWLQINRVEWQIRNGVIQSVENEVWQIKADDSVNPIILAPLFQPDKPYIHAIKPVSNKDIYIRLNDSFPRLVGDSKGVKVAYHNPGQIFEMQWVSTMG